jgi:hypothetical protein
VQAIKLAALEEERALAAGDLVQAGGDRSADRALKRGSAREVADIQKQTTVEIAKDWDGVFDHVSNVFSQTVTGDHQRDADAARNGLRSIFQNITLDFIASKLKELQHHAAIELAKRGITTATAAHKVATEAGAALKSLAITAASAIKEIAIHAARAAAAAFAAIAGIPFVGPVLAPIAAGVALASVLALGGRIASAEGGYDIPHGINPVTQLHQDEMVLPAPLANAVRAMASNGSGRRSGRWDRDRAPLPHPRDRREELRGLLRAEPVGARQGRAGCRAQRPPRACDVRASDEQRGLPTLAGIMWPVVKRRSRRRSCRRPRAGRSCARRCRSAPLLEWGLQYELLRHEDGPGGRLHGIRAARRLLQRARRPARLVPLR